MVVAKVVCANFIHNCLWVLLVSSLTRAIESDIDCLMPLKSELNDPNRHLSNWVFGNKAEGHICEFYGVSCWNDSQNKVLSIELGGLGLEGKFPSGVKACFSLQTLNLTGNNLYGTLPSDIFDFLPYLLTLDLSYKIPASWSNVAYLSTVLLDHNQFTSDIPPGLASLPRLKQLSVAHNHLKGPIPLFTNGNISSSSFEDNPDLCGFSLDPCPYSFFSTAIITASMAAAVCFPVGAGIGWFCVGEKLKQKPRRR